MSVTTRRIVAWIGGVALFGAATWAILLARQPADPAVRVRRLLAQPNAHRHANQAATLIRDASEADPAVAAAIFRTLLADPVPRVRHGALMLLADRFAVLPDGPGDEDNTDEIRALLTEWFAGASLEERLAHLPYSFVCWLYTVARTASTDDPASTRRKTIDLGSLPADELRWLLAVTLERSEPARTLVEHVLLHRPPATEVAVRLRYLDAMDGATEVQAALESGTLRVIDVDDLRQVLPPGLELRERLADPNLAVRQAAGRLLAVCGDARGLPGLQEWLRAHLRFSSPVNTLMTALFGTDWRTRDASGGAARDAGPRGR